MSAPEPHSLVLTLSGGTVLDAAAMLLAFIAVLFLASALLPGRRVPGPVADGKQRVYKLNGLALSLIVAVAAGLAQVFGWFSLSVLHTHFLALILGGRLLISGFWGTGRHLNYTGEICVYFSFALTTVLTSWFPFLLPAWLAGLLGHRSRRDEHRCRAKYGELWDRYTRQARFSMLPFIH